VRILRPVVHPPAGPLFACNFEMAAERIRSEIGSNSDLYDLGVRAHLSNVYGVDVQLASLGNGITRQFDPAAGELRISDLCPAPTARFLIAQQIALLGAPREIEEVARAANLVEGDLPALARNVLSAYVAAAIIMPYRSFLRACRDYRYDMERLGHRFGASFEQICHRVTTLQRRGEQGVPFHLIRTDIAGNISKRFSLSGISIPRHSGACPKWNVYSAFLSPGRINIQISEMPDGTRYFCIAQAITKGAYRHHAQPRHMAVGIGCEISRAPELVYADGIDLSSEQQVVAVGTSCRICPRRECLHRAHPAIDHRAFIDENERPETYFSNRVERA
jgi:predicted transcriptional regulator